MHNDRRLPLLRYRNGENSTPGGVVGGHLVGECFARLLSRELRDRGDSCVVRGDIRTRRRVSKEGIQPESGFIYRIS